MASSSEAGSQLVKFKALPTHLQFNPYITSGYRRPLGTRDCMKSVCYTHNESLNIYSHAFFVIFFLLSFIQYVRVWQYNQNPVVSLFILIDYFATTLPFGLSVLYHTFMCHSGGYPVYLVMLRIDIAGIWLLATFGELENIYVTLYFYSILRTAGISLYVIFSILIFHNLMFNNNKKTRSLLFTFQFLLRVLVIIIRLSPYGCGQKHYYFIVLEICNSVGVVINALHIPERWLANVKMNYFLNGHTIMHFLIPFGIIFARQGFLIDMEWLLEQSQS
ncbi:PREDICTED: progestin and adipoQ receptor family member 4-like [Amphimedon queenslandica]|nr:PREDICTED: progestin and adipoQ receptor family member 4-like [Amphimedon queenslandica]|eukprot:XP_011403436.1 PREDICTED: progestin and adipoQ receptor family member 4-like [Amphimedon queenslandica]